jgi:hypothetical protein
MGPRTNFSGGRGLSKDRTQADTDYARRCLATDVDLLP